MGAVRQGLIALGTSMGGAASLEPLATDFPLTDVAVRDVLKLDTAISTYVDARPVRTGKGTCETG